MGNDQALICLIHFYKRMYGAFTRHRDGGPHLPRTPWPWFLVVSGLVLSGCWLVLSGCFLSDSPILPFSLAGNFAVFFVIIIVLGLVTYKWFSYWQKHK